MLSRLCTLIYEPLYRLLFGDRGREDRNRIEHKGRIKDLESEINKLKQIKIELLTKIKLLEDDVTFLSKANTDLENQIDLYSNLIEAYNHDSRKSVKSFTLFFNRIKNKRKTKVNDLDDKCLCIICYTEKCDSMFIPCCHMVVCENCSTKISECCICRTKVKNTIKVYTNY